MKLVYFMLVSCVLLLSACASYSVAVVPTVMIGSPATATHQPSETRAVQQPGLKSQATPTDTSPAPTASPLPVYPTAASVQVNDPSSGLPTDAPAATREAHAFWMDLPVIPTVSDAMRAVYQRGLQGGNNPHVFAKVGDCSTVTKSFLGAFDLTPPQWYRLGPYTDLAGVITQFNGSYSRVSVASRLGFGSSAVLSPMNSDPKQCKGEESPIECENRILRPSLALIMLGTNDYLEKPADFEKNMRVMIQFWLDSGVVPILSTKADNLEGNSSINAILARLAGEYQLPLWNFWAAAQSLPNQGLDVKNPGHLVWGHDYFDDPVQMQNGGQVRNLTALQALDAVWRGLTSP